jgi:NAD-dependent deacetylase
LEIKMKKRLVVLSGAGISAESGIKTFRDSDGLWEEYNVMDVASIDGWFRNPQMVLDFYNQRRKQLATVEPNIGHIGLAKLESQFDVQIITQNIDNLHERAGSTSILHLHGELTKVRSSNNDSLVTDIGYTEIQLGDNASDGAQLRPHIVWFGEAVTMLEKAISIVIKADIFVIIGTSLNVYPAAGLVNYVPIGVPIYVIDPSNVSSPRVSKHIKKPASEGVKELQELLAQKQ